MAEMMYIKYILLWPVEILSTIIGRILAPFVVPFASTDGWLPRWLWWFQTTDFSLEGDGGWINQHMQWRYKLPRWLSRYVGRVGWLWRNNMHGLAAGMGFRAHADATLEVKGDPRVSNGRAGWYLKTLTNPDGAKAFHFLYVRHWDGGASKKGIKFHIGYALWDWKPGRHSICRYAFSGSPYKTLR
jgi:hypothetical protein